MQCAHPIGWWSAITEPRIDNTAEMVEAIARAIYETAPERQRGDDWDKETDAELIAECRERARHVIVTVNG